MAEDRGGKENYNSLPFITFSNLNLERVVPIKGKLEEEEDDQEEKKRVLSVRAAPGDSSVSEKAWMPTSNGGGPPGPSRLLPAP